MLFEKAQFSVHINIEEYVTIIIWIASLKTESE